MPDASGLAADTPKVATSALVMHALGRDGILISMEVLELYGGQLSQSGIFRAMSGVIETAPLFQPRFEVGRFLYNTDFLQWQNVRVRELKLKPQYSPGFYLLGSPSFGPELFQTALFSIGIERQKGNLCALQNKCAKCSFQVRTLKGKAPLFFLQKEAQNNRNPGSYQKETLLEREANLRP